MRGVRPFPLRCFFFLFAAARLAALCALTAHCLKAIACGIIGFVAACMRHEHNSISVEITSGVCSENMFGSCDLHQSKNEMQQLFLFSIMD